MWLKLFMILHLGVFPLASGQQILFWGSTHGHLQITKQVALEMGFSDVSARIMADASMDPDFYEWTVPAAHAQTLNGADAQLLETEEQAIKNLYLWLQDKRTKIKSALQEGNGRYALYWLGYSLHAVQDLAPHRGMSNAQHSYLSTHQQDPDSNPEAIARAQQFTREYLQVFQKDLGATDWQYLRQYMGMELTDTEKHILIGHPLDMTLEHLLFYRNTGDKYKNLSQKHVIEWNDRQILGDYFKCCLK